MVARNSVNLICLTPVKNEDWILDKFLQSTSLWADYIIIADQNSTDHTKIITEKYNKVKYILNTETGFNEPERQKLLIQEARKIPGKNILFTLDADELFTPNFNSSIELITIINSEPGTVITFDWYNICPNYKDMWLGRKIPVGFVDDGSDHKGDKIHSQRIPYSICSPVLECNDIKIMHFQYTDWNRMQSKHRWYQCFELLNNINKTIDIYRRYHHMYENINYEKIPQNWFENYRTQGIDITSVNKKVKLWWDLEVLKYFELYGCKRFQNLNIWTCDWQLISKIWNININIKCSKIQKLKQKILFKYLKKSQNHKNNLLVRFIDYILNIIIR